ncbi:hypothetical protein CMZ84_00755 [Lysobacteraceae bacterium NML93-0399]|nr:hypothetical protein CMZ84_00755 [Xanthomonadaceae bacterium NML93-0399]
MRSSARAGATSSHSRCATCLAHVGRPAFDTLPPARRRALALHRGKGLTYPEIAAGMGISVRMVEKHISQALVTLRAAVGWPVTEGRVGMGVSGRPVARERAPTGGGAMPRS